MKSVTELRTEYLGIKEQMRDLMTRAKTENRDLLPDENDQFMKMHTDQENLSKAIEARSIMSGMESQQRGDGLTNMHIEAEDTRSHEEKHMAAFHEWLKRGKSQMSPKNLQFLETRGTSTITTETSGLIYGGYAVPEELDRQWTQVMKEYGGMLQVARVIRTQTGGTWNHTYTDDSSTAALLTVEASATTIQDFAFSRIQLGSYTYRSAVLLSLEEIQDEQVGVVAGLNGMLATRMGRALNTAFTTGDGSGKPTGLLASSGGAPSGKTAASATAIT